MSRFLESILLKNGQFPLLEYHQERIDRTLADHGGAPISLLSIINNQVIPKGGIYKIRLEYDLDGDHNSQCLAYQQKLITSLQCIDIGDYTYNYKFANRTSIQDFSSKRGEADDILMIRNGLATDTSYGNVAFYDREKWITPRESLLNGSRRKYLLDTYQIDKKNIGIEDMLQFQYISIFNAMIPLGRILIPTSRIILPS